MAADLVQLRAGREALELARANGEIAELKRIGDMADAARLFAEAQGMADDAKRAASTLALDAKRALGEVLARTPKNHGGSKPEPEKPRSRRSAVVADDRTAEVLPPPSLKDLGISKDQSAQAQKLAAMPDSDFEGFLASATTDGLTVKRALRVARDAKAEEWRTDRKAREATVPTPLSADIRHGTLSEALADVHDVDLVFTDPPYPREFLPAWSELASWAAGALKPGALLAAYSGQYHLPEVLTRLSEHLTYQWLGWVSTTGPAVTVHRRPVSSMGKPLLMFSNGPLKPPFASRRFLDVAASAGRTRELHTWEQGQEPAAYWIDAMTERGEMVVDPFVGSGTFAEVALILGRRVIACDIDNVAVETARLRLDEANAKHSAST